MGARASRQKADITAPPTKESKKLKRRKSKKESITANGDSGIEEVSIQNTETDSIIKPDDIKPEEMNETKKIEETSSPDASTELKSDTSNKENASPNLTEQNQVQSKTTQEAPAEVQKETAVKEEPKEAKPVAQIPENAPSQEQLPSSTVTPKEESSAASETPKEQVVSTEVPKPEEPVIAASEVTKPQELVPSPEEQKPLEQVLTSGEEKKVEESVPSPDVSKSEPAQVPEAIKTEEQKPTVLDVPKPEEPSAEPPEQEQIKATEKESPKEEKTEEPVEQVQEQASVPAVVTEEPKTDIGSPEPLKEQEKIIPQIKEQPATPILESPKSPQLAPSTPVDSPKEETAVPPVSETPKENEVIQASEVPPKEEQSVAEPPKESELVNNISEQTVTSTEINSVQPVLEQSKPECVNENSTIEESTKTVTEEIKTDNVTNGESINSVTEVTVESKSPVKDVPEKCSSEPIFESQSQTVGKILTTFTWEHGGKEVKLCGSFTNWTEQLTLTEKDSVFSTTYDVPEGEHYFQYCVDGVKTINNSLQKAEIQDHGEVNVIAIKASAE